MNEMIKRMKQTLFVGILGVFILTTGMIRMNKNEKNDFFIKNAVKKAVNLKEEIPYENNSQLLVKKGAGVQLDVLPVYENMDLTTQFNDSVIEVDDESSEEDNQNKIDIRTLEILYNPMTLVYDGTEKNIAIEIKDGDKVLEKDNDFQLFYENNIDAGIAHVTVEGINTYDGNVTLEFSIEKKMQEILMGDVSINIGERRELQIHGIGDIQFNVENGNVINLQDNILEGISAGETVLEIFISGDNNYQGVRKEIKVTVNENKISIKDFHAIVEEGNYVYNGEEIQPDVILEKEGTILKVAHDYLLEYSNNIEDGEAIVKVIGIHDYTDEIELSFMIQKATLEYTSKDFLGVYDGNEHTFEVNSSSKDVKIYYQNDEGQYLLEEMPKFKEIGIYTINYKIVAPHYEDVYATNTVTILGIKDLDSSLKIDNFVLKVTDYTFDTNSLLNKFKVNGNAGFIHQDANGKELFEGKLHTGDYFTLMEDNISLGEYRISILGDVNGDGKISSLDYIGIKNHIMSSKKINGNVYLAAADVNNDSKISALDYIRIKNCIMERDK